MLEQPAITARHASAVLVSPSPIDPQSIMPETLSNAKIVPADWVSDNGINTPILALTQYQNGVTIRTEGNRCVFQEPIEGNLREDYEIYAIAQRYTTATMLVPYNAIGINWLLDIAVEHPDLWILEKIMGNVSNFSDFSPASLQIMKRLDFAVCNLMFKTENARIVIDCNYHFQLAHSSPNKVSSALDAWQQCQEHLTREVLPRL